MIVNYCTQNPAVANTILLVRNQTANNVTAATIHLKNVIFCPFQLGFKFILHLEH